MPSQPCHAITYLALITKVNETHTLQSHNQNDAKPLKDIDGILSLTSPSNRRVYTRSRDIRPKTPAIRSPVKIEPNTLDKPAYTHKPLKPLPAAFSRTMRNRAGYAGSAVKMNFESVTDWVAGSRNLIWFRCDWMESPWLLFEWARTMGWIVTV